MHCISRIMCIIQSCFQACVSESHSVYLRHSDKLTHQYNTRSNYKKRMEQENQALREEVSALRLGLDRVTTLVETLVAAQNRPQPTPPPGTPPLGQP